MTLGWYTLRVKPHKENIVYRQLQADDYDVFFPKINVKPKNPRSAKVRPFFPGYLFVNVNLEELGQNAFRWTPGVHGLVEFGGQAAVVPNNLIFELRKRIENINDEGGLPYVGLQQGDVVQVVSGPFAGYEAIFDSRLPGRDRVQVLLAFLSHRPQRVKLHVDEIRKKSKKSR